MWSNLFLLAFALIFIGAVFKEISEWYEAEQILEEQEKDCN